MVASKVMAGDVLVGLNNRAEANKGVRKRTKVSGVIDSRVRLC